MKHAAWISPWSVSRFLIRQWTPISTPVLDSRFRTENLISVNFLKDIASYLLIDWVCQLMLTHWPISPLIGTPQQIGHHQSFNILDMHHSWIRPSHTVVNGS